ncbi:MAG: tRNA (adenosine(37)-N6)-threonylcarbamoyltransferase complex transferase subunit TsaD [Candidatus Gottesmanbacteria bacterium]
MEIKETNKNMNILAIESSCDETSAAVIRDGTKILSNVIATSSAMHEKYGGIVPEVASREQLKCILPVITEALQEAHQNYSSIDAVAVTVGPGLIGSLLIGVEAAKTIAYVTKKPIIPVNHVLAHLYANFLVSNQTITFPAIGLVVSGGHTELFLMKNKKELQWLGGTIDDAAGEAFDKAARLLGFGSRGGLAIQETVSRSEILLRRTRKKSNIKLPRPLLHDNTLNFSFSGLKTAILREVTKQKELPGFDEKIIGELAYEVQESITDVLVTKTLQAAEQYGAQSICIGGGVAANLRLREKFQNSDVPFFCPPVSLCTDNAAYIGSYAYFRGEPVDWHTIEAIPDLSVEV